MAFTNKDVMDLRAKTGVGMMDCKKASTFCTSLAAIYFAISTTKALYCSPRATKSDSQLTSTNTPTLPIEANEGITFSVEEEVAESAPETAAAAE